MNPGNWSPTLLQIIAAIDDALIDERRGFGWHAGTYRAFGRFVNEARENDVPLTEASLLRFRFVDDRLFTPRWVFDI